MARLCPRKTTHHQAVLGQHQHRIGRLHPPVSETSTSFYRIILNRSLQGYQRRRGIIIGIRGRLRTRLFGLLGRKTGHGLLRCQSVIRRCSFLRIALMGTPMRARDQWRLRMRSGSGRLRTLRGPISKDGTTWLPGTTLLCFSKWSSQISAIFSNNQTVASQSSAMTSTKCSPISRTLPKPTTN